MGVVNVTPDSFFDGGRHDMPAAACAHVDRLLAEGADVLDIGGESTRPGAAPIEPREQIRRVAPALEHALARGATVSIDTTSAEVAEWALSLGARIVNDVSCLASDELARVTAAHDAVLVLMHARGPMSQMAGFSTYPDDGYGDVVHDVLSEWSHARDRAVAAGLAAHSVWFDPGLGFAKNAQQSFELLARLDRLHGAGARIVVGPSRKSFIAAVDEAPPAERLGGTIAACLEAVARGADVLRVHDVREVRQALAVCHALRPAPIEVARA